jgi:hypothetical protein
MGVATENLVRDESEYFIAQRRVLTANGPMNRDPRFSEMSSKAKGFRDFLQARRPGIDKRRGRGFGA